MAETWNKKEREKKKQQEKKRKPKENWNVKKTVKAAITWKA